MVLGLSNEIIKFTVLKSRYKQPKKKKKKIILFIYFDIKIVSFFPAIILHTITWYQLFLWSTNN